MKIENGEKQSKRLTVILKKNKNKIIAGILAFTMILSIVIVNPTILSFGLATGKAELASPVGVSPEPQTSAKPQVSADDPYTNYLQMATDAVAAKDYKSALTYLKECEKLTSDNGQLAKILLQEGNILFNLEDYTGAKESFARIIAMDQKEYSPSELYCSSAKCELLLNDPRAAAGSCEKGISLVEQNDEYEAELYVLRGTAYVYLGKYSLASNDYGTAIKKGYSDKETLYKQISLCSYLEGNYSQTVSAGEQVASGTDSDVLKSMSYYAMGAYDKAASAYEKLLNTNQSYLTKAQLYSSIAKCRVLLGEYDEAISKCNVGLAIKKSGEEATLYALRATAFMAKNDYSKALSDYVTSINDGYEDQNSLKVQCASCSYYLKDYKSAIQYGTEAQNGISEDTEAVLWMALSYYESGDFINAEPLLERSLKLKQNYCSESELLRCLSRCKLIQGDYAGAVEQATAGIDKSDGKASGDLYAVRGAAYESQGVYDKALEDFYAAIALGYADSHEMYRQCTLCNFLLKDYDQAVSCGQRALENGGDKDGTLYYWIGISYFSLGQYEKGKQSLAKAAALDDSPENLYFYLGVCCFSLKEYEPAVGYFTRSAERKETVERSIYNRALCYLQLNKYDDAKKDLNTVASQKDDADIAKDAADLLSKLASG
jgi:tetratricopeptide (TPR) repeat protein